MFRKYTEIAFNAGDVLSAAMLEETYRYPRELLHLAHAGYVDGIVNGLDFITKDDYVYLTSGVVKISGKYYILPQDINLDAWLQQHQPSLLPEVVYSLYLLSKDILTTDDKAHGINAHSQLVLEAEREAPKNSLLLARYKFRSDAGISLPCLSENREHPFENFFRAGLLQVLDCAYAHPRSGTTYHPIVFRAIKSYLEQKTPLSPYDFSLLLELQNHGIVSMASLINYVRVNKAVSLSYEDMTREKLFREVCDCVQKHYVPIAYTEAKFEHPQETKAKRHSKLI